MQRCIASSEKRTRGKGGGGFRFSLSKIRRRPLDGWPWCAELGGACAFFDNAARLKRLRALHAEDWRTGRPGMHTCHGCSGTPFRAPPPLSAFFIYLYLFILGRGEERGREGVIFPSRRLSRALFLSSWQEAFGDDLSFHNAWCDCSCFPRARPLPPCPVSFWGPKKRAV